MKCINENCQKEIGEVKFCPYCGTKQTEKKDGEQAGKADSLFQTAKSYCVKHEFEKAVPYLLESARLGDSRAQGHLANFYANGKGVERDEVKSFKWALAAARQGNPFGQDLVGFYYLIGCKSVFPDDDQAFSWFKLSADQDYGYGLHYLGQCYYCGVGVAKDEGIAYDYFRKAADRGHLRSKEIIAGETWSLMTPEWLEKVRKDSAG